MDLGISKRCAAVAASSKGLGFETARALAEEGVRVAICGRDARRVEEARGEIGHSCVGFVCDVSHSDGARAFVQCARESLGRIDILVANCGGPPPGQAEGVEMTALHASLEANLVAMVTMIEAALPDMKEGGFGRIIAITSQTVREPLPNMVHSNTARAGLTGYLKTLAREVAADGITVNSILPGAHETDRLRALGHGVLESLAARSPSGRIGDARDFGRLATLLCAGFARHVNGTTLMVDGGGSSGLF
jgi:3-oxoacyl-[acyl-carrier protein] reductase